MTAIKGSDWAKGLEARSRALVSEGQEAEQLLRRGGRAAGRTPLRPELARAHLLYGEWLRREDRRLDARHQLRAAYHLFAAIGAEAFAERARRELLATGEKVRKRAGRHLQPSSPRRRSTSPGWPETDAPTPRSPRSCSSAPAPSNGTSARCSQSSASPPAGSFTTPSPRELTTTCRGLPGDQVEARQASPVEWSWARRAGLGEPRLRHLRYALADLPCEVRKAT